MSLDALRGMLSFCDQSDTAACPQNLISLQANTLKASIPSHVPKATSDLIAAFTCAGSSLNPYESGHDARQLIDQHLPSCKAMLLQNLPLFHPEVCAAFVDGLGYSHMSFEPPGAGRAKASSQTRCSFQEMPSMVTMKMQEYSFISVVFDISKLC